MALDAAGLLPLIADSLRAARGGARPYTRTTRELTDVVVQHVAPTLLARTDAAATAVRAKLQDAVTDFCRDVLCASPAAPAATAGVAAAAAAAAAAPRYVWNATDSSVTLHVPTLTMPLMVVEPAAAPAATPKQADAVASPSALASASASAVASPASTTPSKAAAAASPSRAGGPGAAAAASVAAASAQAKSAVDTRPNSNPTPIAAAGAGAGATGATAKAASPQKSDAQPTEAAPNAAAAASKEPYPSPDALLLACLQLHPMACGGLHGPAAEQFAVSRVGEWVLQTLLRSGGPDRCLLRSTLSARLETPPLKAAFRKWCVNARALSDFTLRMAFRGALGVVDRQGDVVLRHGGGGSGGASTSPDDPLCCLTPYFLADHERGAVKFWKPDAAALALSQRYEAHAAATSRSSGSGSGTGSGSSPSTETPAQTYQRAVDRVIALVEQQQPEPEMPVAAVGAAVWDDAFERVLGRWKTFWETLVSDTHDATTRAAVAKAAGPQYTPPFAFDAKRKMLVLVNSRPPLKPQQPQQSQTKKADSKADAKSDAKSDAKAAAAKGSKASALKRDADFVPGLRYDKEFDDYLYYDDAYFDDDPDPDAKYYRNDDFDDPYEGEGEGDEDDDEEYGHAVSAFDRKSKPTAASKSACPNCGSAKCASLTSRSEPKATRPNANAKTNTNAKSKSHSKAKQTRTKSRSRSRSRSRARKPIPKPKKAKDKSAHATGADPDRKSAPASASPGAAAGAEAGAAVRSGADPFDTSSDRARAVLACVTDALARAKPKSLDVEAVEALLYGAFGRYAFESAFGSAHDYCMALGAGPNNPGTAAATGSGVGAAAAAVPRFAYDIAQRVLTLVQSAAAVAEAADTERAQHALVRARWRLAQLLDHARPDRCLSVAELAARFASGAYHRDWSWPSTFQSALHDVSLTEFCERACVPDARDAFAAADAYRFVYHRAERMLQLVAPAAAAAAAAVPASARSQLPRAAQAEVLEVMRARLRILLPDASPSAPIDVLAARLRDRLSIPLTLRRHKRAGGPLSARDVEQVVGPWPAFLEAGATTLVAHPDYHYPDGVVDDALLFAFDPVRRTLTRVPAPATPLDDVSDALLRVRDDIDACLADEPDECATVARLGTLLGRELQDRDLRSWTHDLQPLLGAWPEFCARAALPDRAVVLVDDHHFAYDPVKRTLRCLRPGLPPLSFATPAPAPAPASAAASARASSAAAAGAGAAAPVGSAVRDNSAAGKMRTRVLERVVQLLAAAPDCCLPVASVGGALGMSWNATVYPVLHMRWPQFCASQLRGTRVPDALASPFVCAAVGVEHGVPLRFFYDARADTIALRPAPVNQVPSAAAPAASATATAAAAAAGAESAAELRDRVRGCLVTALERAPGHRLPVTRLASDLTAHGLTWNRDCRDALGGVSWTDFCRALSGQTARAATATDPGTRFVFVAAIDTLALRPAEQQQQRPDPATTTTAVAVAPDVLRRTVRQHIATTLAAADGLRLTAVRVAGVLDGTHGLKWHRDCLKQLGGVSWLRFCREKLAGTVAPATPTTAAGTMRFAFDPATESLALQPVAAAAPAAAATAPAPVVAPPRPVEPPALWSSAVTRAAWGLPDDALAATFVEVLLAQHPTHSLALWLVESTLWRTRQIRWARDAPHAGPIATYVSQTLPALAPAVFEFVAQPPTLRLRTTTPPCASSAAVVRVATAVASAPHAGTVVDADAAAHTLAAIARLTSASTADSSDGGSGSGSGSGASSLPFDQSTAAAVSRVDAKAAEFTRLWQQLEAADPVPVPTAAAVAAAADAPADGPTAVAAPVVVASVLPAPVALAVPLPAERGVRGPDVVSAPPLDLGGAPAPTPVPIVALDDAAASILTAVTAATAMPAPGTGTAKQHTQTDTRAADPAAVIAAVTAVMGASQPAAAPLLAPVPAPPVPAMPTVPAAAPVAAAVPAVADHKHAPAPAPFPSVDASPAATLCARARQRMADILRDTPGRRMSVALLGTRFSGNGSMPQLSWKHHFLPLLGRWGDFCGDEAAPDGVPLYDAYQFVYRDTDDTVHLLHAERAPAPLPAAAAAAAGGAGAYVPPAAPVPAPAPAPVPAWTGPPPAPRVDHSPCYLCERCSGRFASGAALVAHLRAAHAHVLETPPTAPRFVCDHVACAPLPGGRRPTLFLSAAQLQAHTDTAHRWGGPPHKDPAHFCGFCLVQCPSAQHFKTHKRSVAHERTLIAAAAKLPHGRSARKQPHG